MNVIKESSLKEADKQESASVAERIASFSRNHGRTEIKNLIHSNNMDTSIEIGIDVKNANGDTIYSGTAENFEIAFQLIDRAERYVRKEQLIAEENFRLEKEGLQDSEDEF